MANEGDVPALEAQTDAELVRRCLAGDQAACARLVSAHARVAGTVIWRVVRNQELVEDLCQETFLRAFRALGSFDGRSRLSTWVCSIAHRVALDELRRQGRTIRIVAEEVAGQDGDDGDLLDQVMAEEEVDLVQAAVNTLPERYRLPLLYAALQELAYEDVAVMLEIPVGTVKTLVFRGKALLRERLAAVGAASGGGAST
jgi:RNA polymerase sigma-70 factor (ECF subfamily)